MSNVVVDSQEQIALAQLSKLLIKYSYRIIQENGDGKNLLMCAGLSSLVPKYNIYLEPHYNEWKRENLKFNLEYAIGEICFAISDSEQALSGFLREFFSRLNSIDEDDIDKFTNYLALLGYKLNIKKMQDEYSTLYKYSLSNYIEGTIERKKDISYLINMLIKDDLRTYYEEMVSTYGNGEYKGCIANCRTLMEKFFINFDSDKQKYQNGILNVTKEDYPYPNNKNTKIVSEIFKFCKEHDYKYFNRFRLFVTVFSLMSGLGVHGEEEPSKEDALLCIRITEDILIWCYQHNSKF